MVNRELSDSVQVVWIDTHVVPLYVCCTIHYLGCLFDLSVKHPTSPQLLVHQPLLIIRRALSLGLIPQLKEARTVGTFVEGYQEVKVGRVLSRLGKRHKGKESSCEEDVKETDCPHQF